MAKIAFGFFVKLMNVYQFSMICCAVFRAMFKTLKISLFFASFLISSASWSQQFDVTLTQNLGGYTSDDPAIFREFVHCKSINEGRTVTVGTVDGLSHPLRWFFIEVDSLGVKVLSNCRQIESSPNTRSIILMDIQVLRNKSGYIACGYQFLNTNPAILKPLSVLFDGSGVPTSSYTYDDAFRISFSINENNVAEAGDKTLFVKITGPEGVTLANRFLVIRSNHPRTRLGVQR